jgi:hypothetical protein
VLYDEGEDRWVVQRSELTHAGHERLKASKVKPLVRINRVEVEHITPEAITKIISESIEVQR